ncbi:hypothetical protein GCM10009678_49280 [Actinomadura kijaniata]|uniref:Uncharacterized protein n=1 Tax=Actinomadura namibiensis TaxID=182080 RepID=A0A7W3QLN1_ACTNM|nr:N-acetyltransferase [Actinomadura namibiensis]MBA8951596.1 hypothetical protein [Actinomadura namibiensis]
MIEVRVFRRSDRDQLAALVNAHVQAVVPGVSLSVNAVLGSLEREPGEFVVDPWVTARVTLVAEQRGRIVAAAHLVRYGGGPEVGGTYRDTAEIRWLLFWPDAAYWPDASAAAGPLMERCLQVCAGWRAARWYADGTLPAPGVYGVPEQWPHVRDLYGRAGFRPEGRREVVLLAEVDRLRTEDGGDGLAVHRTVGVNGTRLTARRDGREVGFVEVDTGLAEGGRFAHLAGWADVGNLEADDDATAVWLVGRAARWLRLARVERLLDYALDDEHDRLRLLRGLGFEELTRTERGWVRRREDEER